MIPRFVSRYRRERERGERIRKESSKTIEEARPSEKQRETAAGV